MSVMPSSPYCLVCGKIPTGRYTRWENGGVACERCKASRPACMVCGRPSNPKLRGGGALNLANVCTSCDASGKRCACCSGLVGLRWSWLGERKDRVFCGACVKGPRCTICQSPVPAQGRPTDDGRRFCPTCAADGVFDPHALTVIADEARSWMRRSLAMPLREFDRCEVLLVDRRAFGPTPEPGFFERLFGAQTATTSTMRAGDFACSTHSRGAERHLRELRVRVLSGHSRAATRLIVAHELTHLWQAEQGLRLEPPIQEGHAIWVEHQLATSRGERALARALEDSTDPVYGDGFRTLQRMLAGVRPEQTSAWMLRRFA